LFRAESLSCLTQNSSRGFDVVVGEAVAVRSGWVAAEFEEPLLGGEVAFVSSSSEESVPEGVVAEEVSGLGDETGVASFYCTDEPY